MGEEEDRRVEPLQRESGLVPGFLALDNLDKVEVRPPIAGYIKGFARKLAARSGDREQSTAAWLGNLWRPEHEL